MFIFGKIFDLLTNKKTKIMEEKTKKLYEYENLIQKLYELLVEKHLCHYSFSIYLKTCFCEYVGVCVQSHNPARGFDTPLLNVLLDYCNSNNLSVRLSTEKSLIIDFLEKEE